MSQSVVGQICCFFKFGSGVTFKFGSRFFRFYLDDAFTSKREVNIFLQVVDTNRLDYTIIILWIYILKKKKIYIYIYIFTINNRIICWSFIILRPKIFRYKFLNSLNYPNILVK